MCVCLITAICVHIPVLYITSTHSQLTMPKHRDADSIAIETGSQPVTRSSLLRSVNIFFVVMEKWILFACHITFFPDFCVCDLRRVACGRAGDIQRRSGPRWCINTSIDLWLSRCGVLLGAEMLQQTPRALHCGGLELTALACRFFRLALQ